MSNISSASLGDLVEKISSLTLVQASELACALKEKLGLPDVSFAAAPVAAGGAKATGEVEKAGPTKFALLMSSHGDKKVAAIKALKIIFKDAVGEEPSLQALKEKFDSLPCKILGDLPKDKADKYLQDLKTAGCECELKGEE